jgi:hypothetical protein
LGGIADKITMLEVAYSRCERHGRLSVAKLIEGHGENAKLTNLRTVLAGDCPGIGGAIYEQSITRNSCGYGVGRRRK